MRVTIDAAGAYQADYGDPTGSKEQGQTGAYNVDWQYHVRGIAKYTEYSGSKPEIGYILHPGTFRAAAYYSANLFEGDGVTVLTVNGSYPRITKCHGGQNAVIDMPYTLSRLGWGTSIKGPSFSQQTEFTTNCPDTSPSDAGFFGTGLGGYQDYRFPFPSAHRAQLRNGTMHASTICTNWKQKASTGPGDFKFIGFMTVKTTLNSFPESDLKTVGKALDTFRGKEGANSKGFNADPFGYYNDNFSPTGKPGCHKP